LHALPASLVLNSQIVQVEPLDGVSDLATAPGVMRAPPRLRIVRFFNLMRYGTAASLICGLSVKWREFQLFQFGDKLNTASHDGRFLSSRLTGVH
jgi:hypothetical protein